MTRKIVAGFLLPAFCFFSVSCLSTVTRDATTLDRANPDQQVLTVVTKDGRVINFRKNDPGRVVPGSGDIVGRSLQRFDVDRGEVQSTVKNGTGAVVTVLMTNGSTYNVLSYYEGDGRVRFSTYVPITIPFSDIQQVAISKINTGRTVLGAVGAVTIVLAVTGVVALVALISWLKHL